MKSGGIQLNICRKLRNFFKFIPYRYYNNLMKYQNVQVLRDHLICHGFMSSYTRWIWYEECWEESLNVRTSRMILNAQNSVHDE
jgi:hypothetical protein